jgi:hypothetical protein
MILYKILNSKYNLSDVENNVKLENMMMGREQKVVNTLRRSIYLKSRLGG